MSSVLARTPLALAVLLACPALAAAQPACGAPACDVVVEAAGAVVVDGAAVAAGATVCVRAGDAPIASLTLRNVRGTAAAPITVTACGGTLRIGGGSARNAIVLTGSEHVRLTGGEARAIRVEGGAGYNRGVEIIGCSAHVELDHFEIAGTAHSGIRSHVPDDACRERAGFSIHHLHIHDVGGEGMFLGVNDLASPYLLRDVEVHDNRIERTGYQGIKMGTTLQDAYVHHNLVLEPGTAGRGGEDTGITGSARTFRIHHNVVARSPAGCIFASGERLEIAGNVVAGCVRGGVLVNGAPRELRILHNTVASVDGDGVVIWVSTPSPGFQLLNNLFVDIPTERGIGPRASNDVWTVEGNLRVGSDDPGFVSVLDPVAATLEDLAPAPFAITRDSPAFDAGSAAASAWVALDIGGVARDERPDVGAHEVPTVVDGGVEDAGMLEEPGDAGVVDAGAADASARADAGPGEPEPPAAGSVGGGCSAGGATPDAALALVLLALACRRRRVSS